MIVSVGIDVGTKGGVSAISGDHDILYVSEWDLSKFKGVVRLREMQKALYDELLNIKDLADENHVMVVSIEEPPNVKNQRAYSVLCQMLGVAQLVVYNVTNSIPLMFNPSTWKKQLGAEVSVPTALRGPKLRKEREAHMKNSVQATVLRYLCSQNKNNLRKVVTSTKIWRLRHDEEGVILGSDVYDALGVATAGLKELENVSLEV